MFTGIVEATGTIVSTDVVDGGRRLRVDLGAEALVPRLGESIAISGVCLTVAEVCESAVGFDVIWETLDKTNLGERTPGDRVNYERSLRIGDRIDGHFVQGHVDGTAKVERIDRNSGEYVVWFAPQDYLRPFVIPKGSITIDGVSLTIAGMTGRLFSVALIPTTLERTTLGELSDGDRANIESDILARTIVHHLSSIDLLRGDPGRGDEKAGSL